MSERVEAYGVRGMQSRPFRKVFKSQRAFEAWLANQDDCSVQGTRVLEPEPACGSGWTGDRCTKPLGHAGRHSNE